jgi:iron complex transport system substrate-binding protein
MSSLFVSASAFVNRVVRARVTPGLLAVAAAACLLLLALSPAAQAQPRRVISTDAGITTIVDALGASQYLVAIDVTSTAPAGREDLPRLGYHRALSAEGLLSLRPDLVLASEHAGPPSTLATLRSFGIELMQLPAALTLTELEQNILAVGVALERENAAMALKNDLARRAEGLATAAGAAGSALLIRENDGVIRVAGSNTAGDALLSLIGARNKADFSGYRSYSVEALLAEDPETLVLAAGSQETVADWLRRYPLLEHLQAVQSGRLLSVSGASLVGGLSLATFSEAEALLDSLSRAAVAAR